MKHNIEDVRRSLDQLTGPLPVPTETMIGRFEARAEARIALVKAINSALEYRSENSENLVLECMDKVEQEDTILAMEQSIRQQQKADLLRRSGHPMFGRDR